MPVTSIKCEWRSGLQRFYDRSTFETVNVHAPCQFREDFLGTATLLDGTTIWSVVDVAGGVIARVADGVNGKVSVVSSAVNEAQDAVLYWGDERAINVKAGCIFETIVNVSVLPTLATEIVWGVAGDHNVDNDTITENAWFKLDGSGALVVETEDTTNTNADVATGITIVPGTEYVCRIDTTVLSDVKFYVQGAGVGTATTFDMSNLSDVEGVMQPYVSVDKGVAVSVGSIIVDKVDAYWKRG